MEISEFENINPKPKKIEPDLGRCENYGCGKVSKIIDCIIDHDNHDGCEMPSYTVHLCPHCDDGEITDYMYSDEQWDLYKKAEKK